MEAIEVPEIELPEKIEFPEIDWGFKKTIATCCGKEIPAFKCFVFISSPGDPELTAEETDLLSSKRNSLCYECYEEWSKAFWKSKESWSNWII